MQTTGTALASATVVAGAQSRTGTSAVPPRPNVVFFIADDLGWGDLGCCGHPYLLTPNADRLARQGTRFTQYYANHAVCSPSRAALLTGHFPARHRVHGGLPDPSSPVRWLDPEAVLFDHPFLGDRFRVRAGEEALRPPVPGRPVPRARGRGGFRARIAPRHRRLLRHDRDG